MSRSGPIISVERLGKRYVLNHEASGGYRKFSDTLINAAKAPLHWAQKLKAANGMQNGSSQLSNREDFWALKDVSIDIKAGEIVGIIGRNGAGKSTLLKLLSRITDPSEGRITLRGRVASLLEVGTGFHPELTGRENIFLNGAILGMRRVEIVGKFDEIVAFAEVEQFLDTPVKRYSSGMYVRLAFAVAAHLEPEILVVDEVLAVGDAQFQKKCLGKMEEVAQRGGRTVLFVSHILSAVSRLCTRGIVLDKGRRVFDGRSAEAISYYAGIGPSDTAVIDLTKMRRPLPAQNGVRLVAITMPDGGKARDAWTLDYGSDLEVEVTLEVGGDTDKIEPGLALNSAKGFEIASWRNAVNGGRVKLAAGRQTLRLRVSGLRLVPGSYSLGLGLRSWRGFEDYLPEVARFEVVRTVESSNHGTDSFGGCVVPSVECQVLDALQ